MSVASHAVAPQNAAILTGGLLQTLQSADTSQRTGLLPSRASFEDIVLATRELVGAWDRAMSQWGHEEAPEILNRWAELDPPILRVPSADRGQRPRHPVNKATTDAAHRLPAAHVSVLPEGAVTSGLIVQMLDGFQVWIGAREVTDIPRGKTRSVLKYLFLNRRRPVTRARLLRQFWPDADAAAARNSLNVTLHRLRRALGDLALLVYAQDAYQLQTSGAAWIDVEEFLGHAEEGRGAQAQGHVTQAIRHYEMAAALYCSDLQDDADTDPEAALQVETQALRDRLNQVLEALASLQETRLAHHACLQATLRHLQLDACNEAAHQRLMRCYARLGQPQLAERQYRACILALRESLGLKPSDATTALYRRIAAREFPGLGTDTGADTGSDTRAV